MSRRVVGPVAVIPDSDGKLRYFHRGAYLPDGLDGDAVQRCIDRGLVAEEAVTVTATEPPADEDDDDSDDDLEGDDSDGDADAEGPAKPKRTASREAWAEYRAAQGHTVEGLDRQALIELAD